MCGEDKYSGQNYEHRRQWIVDRLMLLSDIFAIDIAAYAVLSNHYHTVLYVDKGRAEAWSMDDVIARWYRLYHGNLLVDSYLKGDKLSSAHFSAVVDVVNVWRKRLYGISWFMKCLNEHIAREANKEDKCTRKFWEGRFKSQALLDETALLSCIAYVDLNPIRAGMSSSLELSDYTSIQWRIKQLKSHQRHIKSIKCNEHSVPLQPKVLVPFSNVHNTNDIPFSLHDYLELVDWSGRHIDPKKTGYIESSEPKLLETLGIEAEIWLEAVKNFRRHYGNFAGGENQLRQCAHCHGQHWYKGVG
ncbi:MAG: transposase [Psychrobium sp.]|nr:transposase [Psychrobium sp.]